MPTPQGPYSDILMMGGGGGSLRDFFGSEILAKRDFLGSIKDAWIFLGCKNKQEFFWALYLSSVQINNNISTIYCLCGIFLSLLEKQEYFWVDKF